MIGFLAATVGAFFFEWTLHRFFMHQPVSSFVHPFERHALIHHRIFKADHTYHLHDESHKHTIPMAWWNGPVLISLCALPFLAASWFLGQWGFATGAIVACIGY